MQKKKKLSLDKNKKIKKTWSNAQFENQLYLSKKKKKTVLRRGS